MNIPKFRNAQEAFEHYYHHINSFGKERNGTKRITNETFELLLPHENHIKTDFRKWSLNYAMREMRWYMSGDPSVAELKKYAPIWDKMHGGDDIVNSNYGHLWQQNDQLDKTIRQLRDNPETRQAWISLFDGKNKDAYTYDTPCTLAIGFEILNKKLNMTVIMRSNDLWFGFCNDQYCFSELQKMVAYQLQIQMGSYFHTAVDFHLYERHFYDKVFKREKLL